MKPFLLWGLKVSGPDVTLKIEELEKLLENYYQSGFQDGYLKKENLDCSNSNDCKLDNKEIDTPLPNSPIEEK